jgi:hypothetical protein
MKTVGPGLFGCMPYIVFTLNVGVLTKPEAKTAETAKTATNIATILKTRTLPLISLFASTKIVNPPTILAFCY